jgi:(p)ppGpp synthase/HD superfamily hydrolase
MNINKILKAMKFAAECHAKQFRQNGITPYINHPISVAYKVSTLKDVTEEMIIAAVLHDVLEDCEEITQKQIEIEFGATVANYVNWLTNQSKKLGIKPRSFRKKYDCERLANAPIEVKKIKLCDRINNLSELKDFNKNFISIYINESEMLLHHIGNVDAELLQELMSLIIKIRE